MSIAGAFESPIAAGAPCILCGGQSWQPHLPAVLDYLTDERFDINRCACGMMATHPMPAETEIERYYPPRYRGNRHGFTGRMRVALRRRAIESRFAKNFRGRILDVGCGDGSFILAMRERGWDVCGTEIDPATVQRLQSAGINAKTPDAAEREGFDQPFDAVTCWHVMEHVERPRKVAEWVRTQLKPNGIFQATVPNAACIQARMFASHWLHLDVPRHRYHFTPATFAALLAQAGYSIEQKAVLAIEYDWFGIIQSALNALCSRPNGLFEKLTQSHVSPSKTSCFASRSDAIISYIACTPIAAASLFPMLFAAMLGDGATLTLTCRPKP